MRVISVTSALMLVWLAIPARAADQPASNLSSLPVVAQSAISATLGRDSLDYYAKPEKGAFKAVNPSQKLVAHFSAGGVALQSANSIWKLALSGVGYGEHLSVVTAVAPQGNQNRVEYRRGPLTEWYVNGPVGMEQGFTLDQPPGKANGQPLTIALTLSGNLLARVDQSGTGLTLGGRGNLRYSGLTATDADGQPLPAWVDLRGEQLLLRVKDKGARYPVTIDPWIQQAELTTSDGRSRTNSGFSVAVSGNTIVVGAPTSSRLVRSAAYIFVKPTSGWENMTQTTRLETPDEKLGHTIGFGTSVAIDGNTVVVGAPMGGAPLGNTAYVFVEPKTGWPTKMSQTARLIDPNETFLGSSVAVSGRTVLVGAPFLAVDVFVEPTKGWRGVVSQTARLTASDQQSNDAFGASVSISDNTAVVGGKLALSEAGAAYVFVKPAGGWKDMTQTAKLTASDGAIGDQLGKSVYISGSTVVAGAPEATVGNNQFQGAVYVFLRSAHGWTDMTQTAKLTDSNPQVGEQFGNCVSLAGNTIVTVNPETLVIKGFVFVFNRPKGGWVDKTQNAKFGRSDGSPGDAFAGCVSASGDTVVVGAPFATVGSNERQGKAYVFGR